MKDRGVLIVGDLSEVEARVLALLTGTGVTVYFDEPIPLSQRKGGGLVHGPVQKRGKGKYKKFS